jgi:hypothetical protein
MDMHRKERFDPMEQYRPDIASLLQYLPWMEEHRTQQVFSEYQGEPDKPQSFSFPVYDSTLLRFVKTVQKTKLVDQNYPYVYSRNRIRNEQDEIRLIREARPKDIDDLRGILSKYVLGGMSKGRLWPEGVSSGVFAEILYKLKECIG